MLRTINPNYTTRQAPRVDRPLRASHSRGRPPFITPRFALRYSCPDARKIKAQI